MRLDNLGTITLAIKLHSYSKRVDLSSHCISASWLFFSSRNRVCCKLVMVSCRHK